MLDYATAHPVRYGIMPALIPSMPASSGSGLRGRVLASQADAEQTVYVYIDDFYNTTRLRQHCGLPSPNQYEAQYWATRTQKDAVERKKETEKEK